MTGLVLSESKRYQRLMLVQLGLDLLLQTQLLTPSA
jgi:hypothetical protein